MSIIDTLLATVGPHNTVLHAHSLKEPRFIQKALHDPNEDACKIKSKRVDHTFKMVDNKPRYNRVYRTVRKPTETTDFSDKQTSIKPPMFIGYTDADKYTWLLRATRSQMESIPETNYFGLRLYTNTQSDETYIIDFDNNTASLVIDSDNNIFTISAEFKFGLQSDEAKKSIPYSIRDIWLDRSLFKPIRRSMIKGENSDLSQSNNQLKIQSDLEQLLEMLNGIKRNYNVTGPKEGDTTSTDPNSDGPEIQPVPNPDDDSDKRNLIKQGDLDFKEYYYTKYKNYTPSNFVLDDNIAEGSEVYKKIEKTLYETVVHSPTSYFNYMIVNNKLEKYMKDGLFTKLTSDFSRYEGEYREDINSSYPIISKKPINNGNSEINSEPPDPKTIKEFETRFKKAIEDYFIKMGTSLGVLCHVRIDNGVDSVGAYITSQGEIASDIIYRCFVNFYEWFTYTNTDNGTK